MSAEPGALLAKTKIKITMFLGLGREYSRQDNYCACSLIGFSSLGVPQEQPEEASDPLFQYNITSDAIISQGSLPASRHYEEAEG